MTGSRFSLLLVLVLGAVGACKPKGVPLLPPAEDPANPDAAVPRYEPGTNVFEVSAFEGEALDPSEDEHDHGADAGHAMPDKKPAAKPAQDKEEHDHKSHGGQQP